ncbi:hypothetical protein [Rhizobium sp. L9]|uniref:ATP dependent DNA ligase n=1 Tax=Rhizobium sp. L9 TaxID=1340738 RepID=UPI000BEA0091|nr:hypothetical protein [Rhizobium sp. L9]
MHPIGISFIIGYERSMGAFRPLPLGAYRGDRVWSMSGRSGQALNMWQMAQLRSTMDMLIWKRRQPPVFYSGTRDVVWIKATLIAEIEFRG